MSALTNTALSIIFLPKNNNALTQFNAPIAQIVTPSPSVQQSFFAKLQSAAGVINDQLKLEENPSASLHKAQISYQTPSLNLQ